MPQRWWLWWLLQEMLFSSSHVAAPHLAWDHSSVVPCFTCTGFTVPTGPLQVPFVGVERIYSGVRVIVQTTYPASCLNRKNKENSPEGAT